jgi:hypothetical protein
MDPFPAQGHRSHGLATAEQCMKQVLRQVERHTAPAIQDGQGVPSKSKFKKGQQQGAASSLSLSHSDTVLRMAQQMKQQRLLRRGKLKPYGICTAIPVYLFLFLVAKTLVRPGLLPPLPGGETFVLPALHQVNEFVKLSLRLVYQKASVWLIPFLVKRPKYIYL